MFKKAIIPEEIETILDLVDKSNFSVDEKRQKFREIINKVLENLKLIEDKTDTVNLKIQ